jgi:hypothetical protein
MANFDFNKFKSERIAKTVNGAKAKFICETRGQMLVEILPLSGGQSYTVKYNLNGKRYSGTNHFEDLVNC